MIAHPAVSTETYREKALRKFKQQPLVPVGADTGDRSYRDMPHGQLMDYFTHTQGPLPPPSRS